MKVLAFSLPLIKHWERFKDNAAPEMVLSVALIPFSCCKLMQTHISGDL